MHFIEPLETRIAPAVTATLAAGILTINGDNADNIVSVSELTVPGSYRVLGLTAGIFVDFTGVLGIAIDLRDGTDKLFFDGDDAAGTLLAKDLFVTGKGALTVSAGANVNIKGSVKVEHGGGPNTPALSVILQGAGNTVGQLLVLDGQGSSTVNVSLGARVVKSVFIEGGGGNGNDSATFDHATIGGALVKTDLGKGSDQLSINACHIGGAVTFTASSDAPNFSIQSSSTVKGAVNVNYSGGGAGNVTLAGFLTNVTVTGAAGNETVSFGGASLFGKATLKLGNGTNSFTCGSSQIGGNVTVTGGTGSTSVTLNPGSQIYGTLAVTAPLATSASVSLDGSKIGGKLTMLGGLNADALTVVSSTVTGGIAATLGAGANNLLLDTVDSLAGVTIAAGADIDTVTASNLTLRTGFSANVGAGANVVSVRGSVGGLKLTAGLGSDDFTLRDLFVRGATTVVGGAGDDVLKIADGQFGGAFTFNAGAGSNTFDVEHAIAIDDNVNTVFMGSLTYLGGLNNDTVFLGLDSDNAAITLAAVKFVGGVGTNTLNDNFLIALSTFTAPGFAIV